MKILILSTYYYPDVGGGAEYVVKQYAELLKGRGHDVEALVLTDKRAKCSEVVEGIQVTRLPIKNVYFPLGDRPGKFTRLIWHLIDSYNPFYKKNIDAFLKCHQVDVAICHSLQGWSVSVWSIFERHQIPVVQVIHDYYLLCPNCNMIDREKRCLNHCLKCKLLTCLNSRESKRVSAVVYISNWVKNKIEANGLFKNVPSYVVHNSMFVAETHEEQKQHLVFTFGFIGTISPTKGVSNLIRAFKKIEGNVQLLIAGRPISSDFSKKIQELIGTDKRIKLVGYVRTASFFQTVDVAVFPGIWEEPFGLVALEAGIYRTPSIVSNIGGMTEIVKDGINGLYCCPSSVEDIYEKMQLLYHDKDLLEKLTLNTKSSILDFISPDNMIKKVERICKSVLK